MNKQRRDILHILFRYFISFWNRLAPVLPDELFLKVVFRHRVGYWPNLKNPKTFNEKLQWLKLHDRHTEYTQMVDKIEAKKYVASIIGDKYIIPTLGTWDTVDDIDWDSLPNQFVIKVTSDSGGIVVCKDKTKLDIEKAKAKLKHGWGKNYYDIRKEYPYKDVKPRIIAEQYMEDESGYELKDYKFFCFDGEPKALFVATDRGKADEDTKFDFYDIDFNHLPFLNGHPNAQIAPVRPENYEEMVDVARKLSQGMCHVRVDLYNVKGKIYFGELTFFHWSGMTPFEPIEWDYKMGEMINLPANI